MKQSHQVRSDSQGLKAN